MKNKSLMSLLAVVSSVVLLSSVAQAKKGHYQSHNEQYAYATVLTAEPIIKVFNVAEPEQQCFKERVSVYQPARANNTNRLFATILGAAIGNAVGHKKSNKHVGTVVGAMIGASIADDVAARNSGYTRQQWVKRCETVSVNYQQERVIGYRVTYLFRGETYTTRLKRDPGNSLRVRLSITPAFD